MDEPQAWDVLASAHLSRKPWLTLRQDRVRLPTGAVIEEYFVLEYPAWVNVVAVTPGDRVVLVRQYRHGLGRVGIELPAGWSIRATRPRCPRPAGSCWRRRGTGAGRGGRCAWRRPTRARTIT